MPTFADLDSKPQRVRLASHASAAVHGPADRTCVRIFSIAGTYRIGLPCAQHQYVHTHTMPKPLPNSDACGTHSGTSFPNNRQASNAAGIASTVAMRVLE